MTASTEIALASAPTPAVRSKARKYVFDGPHLHPPLWKELLGSGHVWVARMMDPASHASLLPADVQRRLGSAQLRWKLVAVLVPIVGLLALAGVKSGITAYEERVARIEAQEKAAAMEREAQAKADAAAAAAKAAQAALQAADTAYVTFLAGAEKAPDVYATSDVLLTNPEALSGVQTVAATLASGGPLPEYVKRIEAPGPWPAPVVYKELATKGDFLIGFAIDAGGQRKALGVFAFNGRAYAIPAFALGEARSKAADIPAQLRALDYAKFRERFAATAPIPEPTAATPR